MASVVSKCEREGLWWMEKPSGSHFERGRGGGGLRRVKTQDGGVEVGGQPLCLALRVREGVEVAFVASKHKTEGWRWVDNPSVSHFE